MLSYETQLDLKRNVVVNAYRNYSSLSPSTFLPCRNDNIVRYPRVINTRYTINYPFPSSIWLSHKNYTTFRASTQKVAKASGNLHSGGKASLVENWFQSNRQASRDGHRGMNTGEQV